MDIVGKWLEKLLEDTINANNQWEDDWKIYEIYDYRKIIGYSMISHMI